MLQAFYLDVAYVLQWLCQVFSCVFFSSVLEAHFKCFICLQMHVANVSSGCFLKVDLVLLPGTHLPQPPAAGRRRAGAYLQARGCRGGTSGPRVGRTVWATSEWREPL